MLLRNFGQIVLIIVIVSTSNVPPDCIYFEGDSGFVQLLPAPVLNKDFVLSMEVMTNNCDEISLTIHNGKNFKLTMNQPMPGGFSSDDQLFGSCTGFWIEVKLKLQRYMPDLYLDGSRYHSTENDYDWKTLVDAFRDDPFYLGIHIRNRTFYASSFAKPFAAFIRNIRFDDQVQSIDQHILNGTLVAKDCPKDLIFASNEGAARLTENVTFNDHFRLYFEVKITDCPECCSTSAILLSAISEDSYFIVEMIKNILHVKIQSQNNVVVVRLRTQNDFELCNGKWHRIGLSLVYSTLGVTTGGSDFNNGYIGITAGGTLYSYEAPKLNFTAPLYIGQHPIFKLLSAVEVRNGFKGCFRSLHINGVMPEIIDSNLNEFVKLGSCS